MQVALRVLEDAGNSQGTRGCRALLGYLRIQVALRVLEDAGSSQVKGVLEDAGSSQGTKGCGSSQGTRGNREFSGN